MHKIPRHKMTPELLATLVGYDEKTAELIWLPRPIEMFAKTSEWRAWHVRCCGLSAGGIIYVGAKKNNEHRKKRAQIMIAHTAYSVLNVIWCLTRGEWPEGRLVFADGNAANWTLPNIVRSKSWEALLEAQAAEERGEVADDVPTPVRHVADEEIQEGTASPTWMDIAKVREETAAERLGKIREMARNKRTARRAQQDEQTQEYIAKFDEIEAAEAAAKAERQRRLLAEQQEVSFF